MAILRYVPGEDPAQRTLALWRPEGVTSIVPVNQRAVGRAIYLLPIPGITLTPFDFQGGESFWFPVPPASYDVSIGSDWTEQKVIGLGTVAHPGGQQLSRVSWSSFFPGFYDSNSCGGLREVPEASLELSSRAVTQAPPPTFVGAAESVAFIEELVSEQDVVNLTIGSRPGPEGPGQDANVLQRKMRVLEFTWGEVAGRPFDRLYQISFGEWEPQVLRTRKGVRLRATPTSYKPKPNEDLKDVALRFYGSVSDWRLIAQLNGLASTAVPAKKKVLKLPQPR